jgi:hypothetical protein
MSKRLISYEDLEKKCILLAEKIQQSQYKPDMIVSITRGGLLSAYFLADLLSIKSIETINLSSYEDEKAGLIKDNTKFTKDFSAFTCLIVDDLVDSGNTMEYILAHYKFSPDQVKIATIFAKEKTRLMPDFFVEKVPSEEWIVFPYEKMVDSNSKRN